MIISLLSFAFAADAAAGQSVYAANCTSCHGAKGDGKGPAAVALRPKPTDFTTVAYWAGKKDEDLAGSIRSGKPGTSMTGFAQLTDADVQNLVSYLRTFAPPAQ